MVGFLEPEDKKHVLEKESKIFANSRPCGTVWQSGKWEEMISYLLFTLEVNHGVKEKTLDWRKKGKREARKQTRKGNAEYF